MSEKPQALRDEWRNQSLRVAEKAMRDAIIEECAMAIEALPDYRDIRALAVAIRALKEKP